MIKIDGSYGEGGGQILRTSIGLSVLTKTPVEIYNIRKNRKNPGLKPQHYSAIRIIQQICNADVSNLSICSEKIVFKPGEVKKGKYTFDIGTAGSITLALQAIILSVINSKKTIKVNLIGGTDVKWSPSYDFFEKNYLGLLKKIGIEIESNLKKRGYYPKGGGNVEITIKPVSKIKPLKLINPNFRKVEGLIHISNLPDHINKRIKHSAAKKLLKENINSDIKTQRCETFSPGVGITLFINNNNTFIGSCVIGEKGVNSETVGKKASEKILKEVKSNATIDIYSFDQIVPYLALSSKNGISRFFISNVSDHAKTNMWLVKKFLDVDFSLISKEKGTEVIVST